MDIKSLLQSFDTIAEDSKVHKGTYGTSHGKEDVRDQYGHKIGKVNKDAEAKKDEPKKGRGRPKKGADASGEVKSYDSSALSSVFGGGKKPSKEVGNKSVKHSLKDWIEDVAHSKETLSEEQVTVKPMPGASQIIGQDGKPLGTADAQTANIIKAASDKGTLNLTGDELDETDIGKHNNATTGFAALVRKLTPKYGAEAAKRIAGAQLKKIKEQSMEEDAVEESGLQAYLGNKKYGKDGMNALRTAGQEHASEKKMQNIRAHYSDKEDVAETKDLPGKQDKLDVAKPKGKLDAKDFAALRAKKKVKESRIMKIVEGINFKELMATADSEVQEMLIELQNDVELFKDTGHTSDLLDSFLKVHLHHNKNKITDEGAIGDYTTHGMDSKPSRFNMVEPDAAPTSFKVDPIQATTDRMIGGAQKAGSFLKNLVAPKKTFESNKMKDIQLENWEKQLSTLLTEGITVSSSTGQQGSPDSVSVNATDADAQQLLQVLRQAGVGVFGGDQEHSQYGAPMNTDTDGHGTEPESSPTVVGDGDDMMALIKKMTGIQDGGEQPGTLEPAGEEGNDYEDEEEKLDELSPETVSSYQQKAMPQAMDASNPKSDQRAAGVARSIGRPTSEDGEVEEGNAFSGAVAKAKQDGVQPGEKINVGGKEYPVKEEGMGHEMAHDHEEHETCNECGMYECECPAEEEQVEEGYANEPDEEMMRFKALLGMGNDMHRQKQSQATGNIQKVTMETKLMQQSTNLISDWKKLSGIK